MSEQTLPVSSETPSLNPSPQAEAFKGSPSLPVTASPKIPDHIKSQTFEMDAEGEIEYKTNEETKGFETKVETKTPETKVEAKTETKVEAKAEESKEEETKVEVKPKLKAGLPDRTVIQSQTQQQTEKKVEPRDYSVFPEEIREHVKNTSNPAFNFLRDTYKKLQETEAELAKIKPEYESIQKNGFPASWIEHPEAWRLHPEVQQGFGKISKIEFEEKHWEEQLANIEAGKPFKRIEGYRQNGEPVFSSPIEPSEQAMKDAVRNTVHLQAIKQNIYSGINSFAQTFQQRVKEEASMLENIIDEQWPWHKDPKHPAQKHVKFFEESIPANLPASSLRKAAALLYSSYQTALELLAEKKEAAKKDEILQQTIQQTEPRTSSSGTTSMSAVRKNSKIPPVFDLEGM